MNTSATPTNAYVVPRFDPDWYFSSYPDVGESGIDPLQHYLDHGRHEGRLPCALDAYRLENELWCSNPESALKELNALAASPADKPLESAYAAWALARWHGSYDNWASVLDYMAMFRANEAGEALVSHPGPALLELEALIESGKTDLAERRLAELVSHQREIPDYFLVEASLAEMQGRLDPINRLFKRVGLEPVDLVDTEGYPCIDNIGHKIRNRYLEWLASGISRMRQHFCMVSVIVPAYNCEDTLPTAIRCLQQQSWKNLDIIIVDDASTDGTYPLAQALSSEDSRIRVFRHNTNQGVYAARNTGLANALGKYITVHDSDDWSHPRKIEQQVKALQNNHRLIACLTYYARCTPDLIFRHWRVETSWIHENMSSLMFHRSVRDRIGYWDRVRAGGDTEYYQRILKLYGDDSIANIQPDTPFSFGRHSPGSLSQSSHAHLRSQYNGVRRDYLEAARRWHDEALSRDELYLSATPSKRPFVAPPEIDDTELLLQSGLFDPEWYLEMYPDVAESGENPSTHYLIHGGFEGRDPGPSFSSSGYYYICSDADVTAFNPLLHYLHKDDGNGHPMLPELPGAGEYRAGRETIMVCAHTGGIHFFGAERSLLDIISALSMLNYNVIVSVPSAVNTDYIEELRKWTVTVVVIPYSWWSKGRRPCKTTVNHFSEFIDRHQIKALHANTIVLWEPLIAARDCNIPSLVHARELPEHDVDLCNTLKADPEMIRDHVLMHSDHIIANSVCVADYFNAPAKTTVVNNTVDMDALDIDNTFDPDSIRVAMISSNEPKKGLKDFVELATLLQRMQPSIKCVLVGPGNLHTAALLQGVEEGNIPDNIIITGYVESSREALMKGNIIINLSLCQESFGRTILEAMAARRPVIVYDWGGLPELVEYGVNGYIVPYRDIAAVADKIAALVQHPEYIIAMGEAGREIARNRYGRQVFIRSIESAYSKVLSKHTAR